MPISPGVSEALARFCGPQLAFLLCKTMVIVMLSLADFFLGYVSHSADIAERQQELLFSPEGIVTNPGSTEIIRSPFYLGSYPVCLRSIFYLAFPITKLVG